MKKLLDEAFKCAIKATKDAAPVQCVLAAAFLAMFFEIKPEKPTIEKLSAIIKRNGDLKGTLENLKDTEW